MTEREIYKERPEAWPKWLSEEEQERLIQAAREGENAKRDTLLLAGMMYLGLDAGEAAGIQYCRACGDALENERRKAFRHIPGEYRRLVYEMMEKGKPLRLSDTFIDCTKATAEKAIKELFDRAGISGNALQRLKRTAARLHYSRNWTREEYILRWFPEVGEIAPENKVLFFREKTEAEEQAELDKAIENMPSFV